MGKYVNIYKNYNTHKVKKKDYINPYSTSEKNTGGLIGGVGYTAGKLGLGLGGVVEGVGDIVAAGGDLIRGDTEMAEYRFKDNMTGDAARKLDEWYNPGGVMRFVGDTASGIGQSSVFLLDAVAPGLGTGLFFAGVGGQSVASAAEQTGNVGWRELGYGAASAGIEAVIGKAIGAGGQATKQLGGAILKNTGKTAAKKAAQTTGKGAIKNLLIEVGKSAAGEGFEEGVSEVADTWLLQWFGIDEDAETSIGQVLYAAGVGAVSGGLMTAGPAAINYNQTVKAGRAVKEAGEVDILLQRAKNAVAGATRAENRAKNEVVKGKDKYTAGDNVFKKGLDWNKATFGVNRRAKQESRQAKQIRETLEKNIKGYEGLSEAVRNSEGGDALLGNLLGNVYLLENAYRVDLAEELIATANPEMKQAFVDEINEKAKAAGQKKTDYTVQDLDSDVDGIRRTYASSAVYEMMLEKMYGVGNAAETDKEAQEGAKKVTGEEESTEAGREAVTENQASEKKPEDIWLPMDDYEAVGGYGINNEQEAALLRAAKRQGVPAASVPSMLNIFRQDELSPEDFAEGWMQGVGVFGRYNVTDIPEKSALGRMKTHNRVTAFQIGRALADVEARRREKQAEQKKAPAKSRGVDVEKVRVVGKGAEQGQILEETVTTPKTDGRVIKEKGVYIRDEGQGTYVVYKASELMAKVLGTDIHLHKTLGKQAGGKVNGYYNTADNTIHIALDAGKDAGGAALFTLAHEVTHYIRAWSPSKFKALSDFVGEHMGADMEGLIARKVELLRKLDDYKDLTVTQLNDAAHEEVIADAMETILSDGAVMEELATYDKSIWEKIKDFIVGLIEKIKKAYGELKPNSQAAKVLKDAVDDMSKLQRLWAEGVREAGERTRKAEAESVTRMNEGKGQIKYSSEESIDADLLDFYYSVMSMSDQKALAKRKKNLGIISKNHAQIVSDAIKKETGKVLDVSGYELWIDGSAIRHIEEKHGKAGSSDHSMKNPKDVARIEWAANYAESGRMARTKNGKIDYSTQYRNSDGSPSPKILLEKEIGNGRFIIAECVPDSNSKKIHIISARIEKGDKGQVLNVESSDSPQPTSETPLDGNVTKDSITQPSDSVKRKFSISDDSLVTKYPNLNLNLDISDMDGVPAIQLEDGSVLTFTEPHVTFIQNNGIDVEDIRSGGWITDGVYEPSERSDTLRYKERMLAKKRMDEKRVAKKGDIRYSIDETLETPDVYEIEDETPLEAAARRIREREAEEKGDVWTLEDEDRRRQAIRDHELLADALMETAQSESEYRTVKKYKEKVELIADAESRITELRKKTAELNREMDSLREKIKGVDKSKREVWIMTALDDAIAQKDVYLEEMDELSEMIRKEEAKLLSLAAAKPLQKAIREANKRANAMARVAERERQRAEEEREKSRSKIAEARAQRDEKIAEYKAEKREKIAEARAQRDEKIAEYKAEKRQKIAEAREQRDKKIAEYKAEYEAREEYKENSRQMSVRERAARRVVGRMNTMFYNPTKTKHVPADLQALVEAVLKSEKLDTFKETRKNLRQMAEMERAIEKLEQNPARTAEEQETLDKLYYKYAMFEDEGLNAKSQAVALYTAFKEWMERRPPALQDKALLEQMSADIDAMQDMPLSVMSMKSLEAVEHFYKAIYHQVNTANQAFATEKATSIDQMSTKANTQVKETKALKFLSPRALEWAGLQKAREFLWKNMKPLTVFEAIGSDELMSIFKRVLDGEDVWITDILEAKKALDEAKKKYGYNKWDLKQRREVTTADGSKVSLTLGEMMSLYAYMFREQAEEHLRTGGFVFAPDAKAIEGFKGDVVKYTAHLNDQTPHRMRTEDIAKMSELLTEEQKAYAKRVQEYLTSLGAKGNEVSRKLYGIDLFKETAYFPIKSSQDYIETSTGKNGDPNIKSRGTFKETVPEAGNPIVLEDFMEVVGNHINTMATYHAFVLPVEDLTRVWNYTPVNIKRDADGKAILDENGMPVADTEGEAGYNSLKAEITKKYGKEANDYILQLLRDLNGGARRESAASILDKGLTAFKRSATMLSLSTIVQQPTSIIRAMAYVDAKHFTGASFVPWDTVKKYAPVAAIKEMGGFDTGTGVRTAEYINAKEYDSIKDVAKAAVKPEIYGGDPNVRAEAFGWLTGKADEVSWRYLFGAIVNEQAEKLGKAKDSEEVLKAAGERFAEVVRRTQVYDSTLTRSEYMRSKDGLMKMATAFGAEPTTVVSMVVDAIIRAERGDKTFLRKSAAGIAFSIIANAAVASVIYAIRDDDEDETLPEKYVQSVASELIEGFNPLEYLPIARDVVSMFKGYEIERSDMALVGNLMEQVELITSSKRSVPDKIFGVTGAVSAFFGLPVTNVYRDLKGIVKTGQSFTDAEEQTGAGFGFAMGDAVSGQFNLFAKLFGAESGNAYELYTAYVRGDTSHYERVKARYKSGSAAEMALRTELRDNDKRINQAAWAKHTGELEVYESIIERIESEGIFGRDIVIRAINNEVSEIKREIEKDNIVPKDETDPEYDETAETEGLYVTYDLTSAMERGDTADVAAIIDQMVRDKMAIGKTEKEAKASLRSASTAYWKQRYIAAWKKNDAAEMRRIRDALEASGLYGGYNDMIAAVRSWIQNAK